MSWCISLCARWCARAYCVSPRVRGITVPRSVECAKRVWPRVSRVMRPRSIYRRTSGPSEQRSLLLPPHPLVTALLQTVADSVQTCNASFASFSKLASLASFASMQVWRALFWHSSAKFECRFGGFRRFRRFFPKSLRTFDKIWVSLKQRLR